MAPRVLVLGRSGQVAQALARRPPAGVVLAFAGREQLDLSDPTSPLVDLIETVRPEAVVNAAAYTQVDRAETDEAACRRLNAEAPARIAQACARADIPLVHFSSDFVFDGEKGAPYCETDQPRPLNVYGHSKADGEAAVAGAGGAVAVIRTSGVFSPWGPCFPATIMGLAAQRDEISVIGDLTSCPTAATDCAAAALALAAALIDGEAGAQGVFHAAGDRGLTWADFAETLLDQSSRRGGPVARVRRITAADWNAPARRPRDSRLDCARLEDACAWRRGDLDRAMADWFDQREGGAP